ncbi:MAG: peptidase S8, partial [Planctomycetes bacterium]|nr:peptidase S8 [Planctomycetota bacterium]
MLRELRSVAGLAVVQVPQGGVSRALAAYRADQSVRYAEPDYPIEIADVPNDPDFDCLLGRKNTRQAVSGFFCFPTGTQGADIRAPDAWDVWTGDPDFRIAIIDTGINYLHPDLAPNVWTNPGEVP